MADPTDSRPSPFMLFAAVISALVWIGYVVFAALHDGVSVLTAPREWVRLIAEAFVPIAAIFAILAALKRHPASAAPLGLASDSLEEAEARFTAIVTRVETVRSLLAANLDSVTGGAQALEANASSARTIFAEIATASQTAASASASLAGSLPLSADMAAAINTALLEAGAEAKRQAEVLATSQSAIADILSGADSAFASTADALVAVRDGVASQSHALAAALMEARAMLDQIGSESARAMTGRLDALAAQAAGLDARLQSQLATTEAIGTNAERSFQLLDSRLGHSAETSRTTLDALSTRIQGVTATIAALTEPLRDSKQATAELESTVSTLRETAMQTVDVLAETLPVRTVEASKAADTMTSELRALASIIDEAHAKAAALASPIAESRAALLEATEGYAAQRVAVETAGQALVVELEQARQLIAQVEEQTRDTSLAAATRLVDAMTRVREVAQQTAGTMRETLDGVIGEARDSLAAAADTAMRQSFTGPIVAQAREAETIAQGASERTAASMAALAGTLKLLDARAADRTASLEEAAARDLQAASSLLTDRLASKAISIASALGKPMSDTDWIQWRKGERTMFNRRALGLLEKREAKSLKDLLESDADFADHARHYTAAFQALLTRLAPTAESPLASALLSSEPGRLAAALTEVLED